MISRLRRYVRNMWWQFIQTAANIKCLVVFVDYLDERLSKSQLSIHRHPREYSLWITSVKVYPDHSLAYTDSPARIVGLVFTYLLC